jgi:uncharacterized protein (TIGR02453 family)
MPKTYFTPELFKFLRDLARNNDRAWFAQNKQRFEQHARDPFLAFIRDLAPGMAKISKQIIVDPRPNGGSMMRIYRDTRFSKDKTPFKTGVAAHFEHGRSASGGPGFYLHLEPGESGAGTGIWRPEPGPLKQIRDAIAADPKLWHKAAHGREFKTGCGMIGESLKRPPAGYDPAHPAIEDLKRKDFAISNPIDDEQVTSPHFMDDVLAVFAEQKKFVGFIAEALGLSI